MSNASIIKAMKDACGQWDAGEIDSNQLKENLFGLACALENVKRSVVEQADEWRLKIEIASDYGNFEGHTMAISEIKKVLEQIRAWIESLPT